MGHRFGENQELKLLDPKHAQVYYEGGHPAFAIQAIAARDAIGTAVPTTLKVTDSHTLTLEVHHRTGHFTYPILGGAGWEGGFVSTEITGPQDEAEIREEQERIEQERLEELEEGGAEGPFEEETEGVEFQHGTMIRRSLVGPPIFEPQVNHPEAPIDNGPFKRRYKFTVCMHKNGAASNQPPTEGGTPVGPPAGGGGVSETHRINNFGNECEDPKAGGGIWWAAAMSGFYRYVPYQWVKPVFNTLRCNKLWGPQNERPAVVGCLYFTSGGNHPDQYGRFHHPINVGAEYRFAPETGRWSFSGYTCLRHVGTLLPRGGKSPLRGPIDREMKFVRFIHEACPHEGFSVQQ